MTNIWVKLAGIASFILLAYITVMTERRARKQRRKEDIKRTHQLIIDDTDADNEIVGQTIEMNALMNDYEIKSFSIDIDPQQENKVNEFDSTKELESNATLEGSINQTDAAIDHMQNILKDPILEFEITSFRSVYSEKDKSPEAVNDKQNDLDRNQCKLTNSVHLKTN